MPASLPLNCLRPCGTGSPWSPACGSTQRSAIRPRLAVPASAGGRAWSGPASPRSSSASTTRGRDGAALWAKPGHRVPIRYVLVRDPTGEREPQAFLCTDLTAEPLDILRWFVRRWSIEVTFAEVRRHLGVETQRQCSDRA